MIMTCTHATNPSVATQTMGTICTISLCAARGMACRMTEAGTTWPVSLLSYFLLVRGQDPLHLENLLPCVPFLLKQPCPHFQTITLTVLYTFSLLLPLNLLSLTPPSITHGPAFPSSFHPVITQAPNFGQSEYDCSSQWVGD